MKAGIFLTVVSLLGSSAAHPHRHHRHLHNVRREVEHRELERREVITEIKYVTVTAPVQPAAAPAVQPASPPATNPKAKEQPSGFGIGYSPYSNNGSCKTADEVSRDIDLLSDYAMIRLYGVDCDQLNTVISAVKSHGGKKLFLGIYYVKDAASEAQQIVDAVKKNLNGDWSLIETVSVGNEAVKSGASSIDQVVAGIREARTVLRSSGYSGPVVTVDTVDTFLNADGSGLKLCRESDLTAANCHAFFDRSGYFNEGSTAGKFVKMQAERLKQGCPDKRVIITESGWPHKSSLPLSAFTNLPIPDEKNHLAAIASLKAAFADDKSSLVLFSARNHLWKKDDVSTCGTEKWWGLFN